MSNGNIHVTLEIEEFATTACYTQRTGEIMSEENSRACLHIFNFMLLNIISCALILDASDVCTVEPQ